MTAVWVEHWQHECCGPLFAVGDLVSWPVVGLERDALVRLLGEDLARDVRWYVERHDVDVTEVRGQVLRIRCVFHDVEVVTAGPDAPHGAPAPGTASLHERERTPRHEQDDARTWAGYLVDLRLTD